ncbi:transcriptional regulator [Nocardia seriolae]|uniref:Lipoprotein LprD n=1 Tax=Nocardia seriolae TaxID=37332 RepID=A0A0B8N7I4_9NOCA|nr:transcriptional regulator [Nocardia seriolae]APB01172.1 Putative lipoprotein LprD [Nocardia seriolae]MTJ61324.1 transcriptional regulator [Nocardia seriolae]MTJ71736.1 transcriptional regulator [Nocardia seriolae]MTJ90552.1 transcriptional regulator [Nocardia seriolae]MTK34512.1 transcriptional regulator [Nocardia seriolae]
MESVSAPQRRPALIIFVIVAFLACLGLGYWQWTRFESGGGTYQNLGYALQWPLFAGFVVWAYVRFVRLENEAGTDESAPSPEVAESAPTAARPRRPKSAAPREIPAGLLPERPRAVRDQDPELAEYNRYLAELHAQDMDDKVRDAGLHHTERSAG